MGGTNNPFIFIQKFLFLVFRFLFRYGIAFIKQVNAFHISKQNRKKVLHFRVCLYFLHNLSSSRFRCMLLDLSRIFAQK
jgi:hypothetical protein